MAAMAYERITIDPNKMGGLPCIRSLRIPVGTIIGQLAAGAVEEDRVIVSEDTDFGALLARKRTVRPSFVLLRTVEPMTPDAQAALLIANLDEIAPSLAGGCIASIGRGHLRIRPLPLRPVADEP